MLPTRPLRVQGSGSRGQGSGCRVRVQGSIQGSGFRVQISGFRVQDSDTIQAHPWYCPRMAGAIFRHIPAFFARYWAGEGLIRDAPSRALFAF